jgi:hypothetical protein
MKHGFEMRHLPQTSYFGKMEQIYNLQLIYWKICSYCQLMHL